MGELILVLILSAIVIAVYYTYDYIVNEPKRKKAFLEMEKNDWLNTCIVYESKNVGIQSINGDKIVVRDKVSKRQIKDHRMLRMPIGSHKLVVGYYKTNYIGSNIYNNSYFDYTFKPDTAYRLFCTFENNKIDYHIEVYNVSALTDLIEYVN